MGRTIQTFRNLFEGVNGELSIYRRALRGKDKEAFDEVINKARKHISSSSVVPTIDPLSSIILSILIEQQKEINELKELINVPIRHKIQSEEQNDNKMDQR